MYIKVLQKVITYVIKYTTIRVINITVSKIKDRFAFKSRGGKTHFKKGYFRDNVVIVIKEGSDPNRPQNRVAL